MIFKNTTHAMIYKTFVITAPYKFSNQFLAAAFLLSASKETWHRAKLAFHKKTIDFAGISKSGLTEYGYALVSIAQDLYEGTTHVNLYDLCDKYVIQNNLFDLVVAAMHISRGGYEEIGINKTFQ